MASMRISAPKISCSSVKSAARFDRRQSVAYSVLSSPTPSRFSSWSHLSVAFGGISPLTNRRLFSSSAAKDSIPQATNGRVENFKEAMQNPILTDAMKYTGEKAKQASNEVAPHVQQWLGTQFHLNDDVIFRAVATLAGTLFAWTLFTWGWLPWLFRKFHKKSQDGRGSWWPRHPYEKSVWEALEVPFLYHISFAAFLQIGRMVAPRVIASQFVELASYIDFVIAIVWFFMRWKSNLMLHYLDIAGNNVDRKKLRAFGEFSSVLLFSLGSFVLANTCVVSLESFVAMGVLAGMATMFECMHRLGRIVLEMNL